MEINKESIDKVIKRRADLLCKTLYKYIDLSNLNFRIAGNALNAPKRQTDIDIFPKTKDSFTLLTMMFKDYSIFSTKNAVTYKLDDAIVQVCNYVFPTLKDLVDSFDYGHIQIGVEISDGYVTNVYYTGKYINSKIIGDSQYIKSQYPLSSVFRALKYKEYKEMSKSKMLISVLSALTDVIERGFFGYQDFKDQLDAVDLGLLVNDINYSKEDQDKLYHLFELLNKNPGKE